VGDGSIPPPALNCTPFVLAKRRRLEKLATEKGEVLSLKERPQRKKVLLQHALSYKLTF
jgi:hypothetical protein